MRALAVDLGGTELRAAIVDRAGAIGAFAAVPPRRRRATGGHRARSWRWRRAGPRRGGWPPIVGLGVGAPGPLDPIAGISIGPPTLAGWHDVPLAALLRRRLGLPVRLENDANAAALGEWRFGAGRGTRSMVFVTVSTGIGGGVIVDGRLLHGRRGLAAEIGHMTIAGDSEDACFCGVRRLLGVPGLRHGAGAAGRPAGGGRARPRPCGDWPGSSA